MLSDKYLAALPAALVLLYSQAEEDILSDMARKIAAANFYLSSAQWQHERLQLLGMTSRKEKELSKNSFGGCFDPLSRTVTDAISPLRRCAFSSASKQRTSSASLL